MGEVADRARLEAWRQQADAARAATEAASAAIAALALALNDWLVAPACAELLGGPRLVIAQRAVRLMASRAAMANSPAGHAVAALDGLLTALPARLTALLLALAAPTVGATPARVLRLARRERRRLADRGRGWPIAAMAVALGRCLDRPGRYRLHPGAAAASSADVARAWRLAAATALLAWHGARAVDGLRRAHKRA